MAKKTIIELLKSVNKTPLIRDKKVSFLLTQNELDSLNKICKDFSKNRSDLIVDALMAEGLLDYVSQETK